MNSSNTNLPDFKSCGTKSNSNHTDFIDIIKRLELIRKLRNKQALQVATECDGTDFCQSSIDHINQVAFDTEHVKLSLAMDYSEPGLKSNSAFRYKSKDKEYLKANCDPTAYSFYVWLAEKVVSITNQFLQGFKLRIKVERNDQFFFGAAT
ncbi:MAG TPA: hypothetical protein VJ729_16520 [Nitrososphaeraceae archaeon]|nr:hypothetical protein [Nitrososphaeraceae archaeon]